MSQNQLLALQTLIEARTGLQFNEEQTLSLEMAVQEGVAASHCLTFEAYMSRLTTDAAEFDRLVERITVGETAFFRNEPQFQALSRQVLPELIERRQRTHRLRLWSAGCSSGQEAYSLAMAALEAVDDPQAWGVQVLGSDINRRLLEIARRGVYQAREVENVAPYLLYKYFVKEGDRFRARQTLRNRVAFDYFNLVEPSSWDRLGIFDLIFCRNVTIYFSQETTEKVIERLRPVLADDGYLFLGYSETLWQRSDDFRPVDLGESFAYRKVVRKAAEPEAARSAPVLVPQVCGTSAPATGRQPADSAFARVPGPRADRPPAPPAEPPEHTGPSLEDVLAHARQLHEQGQSEVALERLRPVLTGRQEDGRGHLLAAQIAADRGNDDDALEHCRRAIRLDPLLREAHFLLGLLHLRHGEGKAAAQALRRAIYLQNNDPLAYFHLASALRLRGDSAGVARAYRHAARLLRQRPPDELLGELSVGLLLAVCEQNPLREQDAETLAV